MENDKACWILNDLRQPHNGGYYFVIIQDRDRLIKDVIDAADKYNLMPGECCWEQLDGRKYSENAKVIYWLESFL